MGQDFEGDDVSEASLSGLLADARAHHPWDDAYANSDGRHSGDAPRPTPSHRHWRAERQRWLATLNPGRTPHEYAKAIAYFFETPGVPQHVDDLTFDLLLAYRGALALRATSRERATPATTRRPLAHTPPNPTLDGVQYAALPGAGARSLVPHEYTGDDDDYGAGNDARQADQSPLTPLAPATVNIRLTALRQFLVHVALLGDLPELSPERIRLALRRLSIERRRPYQVLAEPEWDAFLSAARLPATSVAAVHGAPPSTAATATHATPRRDGPWGTPRARRSPHAGDRHELAADDETATSPAPEPSTPAAPTPPRLPRSRTGLTGQRTGQRDHALLALALATGLRAIELAQLDLGDLTREWHAGREEWWLVLPDAKTKGQHGGRTLPLAPDLVETLLAYVRATGRRWERAADRATPLFLSGQRRRGGIASVARRLSTSHIRCIVDRVETQWLALRAGREPGDADDPLPVGETRAISPHALRHSTAIALLEGNSVTGRPPASVEHVRGWLGHFDIRTTQNYLAHLESRRHRRPFTLTPLTPATPPTSGTPTAESDENAPTA